MKELKGLRKSKGLTQTQVAEVLGVTFQAYSRYENGFIKPDNDKLVKLSELFGVTVKFLDCQFPNVFDPQERRRREEMLSAKFTRQYIKKGTTSYYFISIPVFSRLPYNIDFNDYEQRLINALPYNVDLPFYYEEADKELFAFILNDDCLSPDFIKGNLIIAQQEFRIKEGDTIVVSFNLSDYSIRRLKNVDGALFMTATDNSKYPPVLFEPSKEIRFLGVVLEGRHIEQHLYYLGKIDES